MTYTDAELHAAIDLLYTTCIHLVYTVSPTTTPEDASDIIETHVQLAVKCCARPAFAVDFVKLCKTCGYLTDADSVGYRDHVSGDNEGAGFNPGILSQE